MLLFVSYLFFGWNRFSPLGLGVYPAESVEGSPTHPACFPFRFLFWLKVKGFLGMFSLRMIVFRTIIVIACWLLGFASQLSKWISWTMCSIVGKTHIYICIHISIYICIHIHIYLYTYIYMYVCMHTHICVYIYICMHTIISVVNLEYEACTIMK